MGEYSKENKLAFEKKCWAFILAVIREEHEERWRRMISNNGRFSAGSRIPGNQGVGEKSVVGGMIVDKTVKYTKNNKRMAFLTLEDMLGSVEVVIFRDYEKNRQWLEINEKVFIKGRVSEEDDEKQSTDL